MSWKRWIHEVRFSIRLASPLHIGVGEDELLVDDNGRAIIPGSSLAGAWRAFVERQSPEKTRQLFGRRKEEKETGTSDLFVHDLISERVVFFEERPAVRIDGAFGSADKGDRGKFERRYVATGERFIGKVVWTADEKKQENHLNLIKQIFSAWHHGFIRLGKYKSTGAGRVEITSIRHRAYDCWDPDQYFEFLKDRESGDQPLETWGKDASDWFSASPTSTICQFRLAAELDSALLIRGNSVSKAGEPDAMHIRNVAGQFIIPGSSWKGVLRHHVEKIARYYGVPEMVGQIFGHAASNQSEGRAGVVIASDALIENASEKDYTGIRIDRLTGGVMSAMMKKERTVRGSVELVLDLRLDQLPDDRIPLAKGLLLLAFRDLAEQELTLGSGYASGRGRLKGRYLTVQEGTDRTNRIEIHFESEKGENLGKVNGWISTLAGRRTG